MADPVSGEPLPVAQALAWAIDRLGAAGVDSPRADAQWLLIHLIGGDPGTLAFAEDLTPETAAAYRRYIDRRGQRQPLQHITGSAPFGPLDLSVGPGVFIPRPETEWLLDWAQRRVAALPASPHIVDLCSGSGALAIGLALLRPDVRITAVELSMQAREWLHRNLEQIGVADRVRVIGADATDATLVEDIGAATVDLLVSNPPYVPDAAVVSPEVAADPREAVFAGADGLAVIRPMASVIARLLADDAPVAIEHDETSAADVREILRVAGGFAEIESHCDLTGRPRFTSAVGVGA